MASRRTRSTPPPVEAPSKVVRFPPMPPIPAPPRLALDPRQAKLMSLIDRVSAISTTGFAGAAPRFATGFYASAVDLGRLQEALARGISRFTMAQVHERWDEVREWMHGALATWVQRRQFLKLEVRKTGVHVQLETRDDLGTYSYGFDVFPGRGEES